VMIFCCSRAGCEDENSQEIEIATPKFSRQRADCSVHMSSEAFLQLQNTRKSDVDGSEYLNPLTELSYLENKR
jgi:hypothetical protein